MHLGQVERFQRNQPVFNRIVQVALHACAVMVVVFQNYTPKLCCTTLLEPRTN